MIRYRYEACKILGIPTSAGIEEARKAYKKLAKVYHPDAGITGDAAKYNEITEAYQYILAGPEPVIIPNERKDAAGRPQNPDNGTRPQTMNGTSGRILGDTGNSYYRNSAAYSSFEKKYQQQKAEKQKETDRKLEEYAAQMKQQEEDYNKAIEAIRAIRMAEILKQMIAEHQD